jgi:methylated-DNA-[protein]-cysteine S-methyltransferase
MKFSASTVQARYDSPLGRIILAAAGNKLVGVWFDGQRHQPDLSTWPHASEHPVLQQAQSQLTDYFAGRRTSFDLPLDFAQGTGFQQDVWRALLKIPRGATCSYGTLSADIGKPAAVRAVGGAVGRNPLSIIVPCHRVMGGSGALTGYAGGIERKIALLQLEGAVFKPDTNLNHLH